MLREWSIINKDKNLKYLCILLAEIIKENLCQVILVRCYHNTKNNNLFFRGLAFNSISIFVGLFQVFESWWRYLHFHVMRLFTNQGVFNWENLLNFFQEATEFENFWDSWIRLQSLKTNQLYFKVMNYWFK